MTHGFELRAPWYVRERGTFGLRDPRSLRPALQKYGDAGFATRILADPRDSLRFVAEDRWSYPVPIPFSLAKGRGRFATHRLQTTEMRKLFLPTHDRFYTVVLEVFCDEPGLPRAGSHDDLEVGFVMRRQRTSVVGDKKVLRRLARNLIVAEAKQGGHSAPATTDADSVDLTLADAAWKRQFAEDHGDLLAAVAATHDVQTWMVNADGGLWRDLGAPPPDGEPLRREEEHPMWRLPSSAAACPDARSRSLWFGVVPTFSAEHWIGPGEATPLLTKLDEHEIYELTCFVRQRPEPGHEHCPPRIWWSKPTQPFRLAAPFDPDGTKNHSVTITAPDLRRLAATASQKLGPGGVRIVTPPNSGLPPPPFGDLGASTGLALGAGGTVCTFAFELFFLVALFLFLLFLPIVVFLFQLWWMLALRFCLPPAAAFAALAAFLRDGGDLPLDPTVPAEKELIGLVDEAVGLPGAIERLASVPPFKEQPAALRDLVDGMDPANAAADQVRPEPASKPDDPLCPPPLTPP